MFASTIINLVLIFVLSATLDSGSAPQGEAFCELEADGRHHQDQGALEAQQGLPVGTFDLPQSNAFERTGGRCATFLHKAAYHLHKDLFVVWCSNTSDINPLFLFVCFSRAAI
jgi:hypothetical protein